MTHQLFPFQETGVEFLLNTYRGMLCDEQGLGKTLQTVTAIKNVRAKRILVVCPASLKLMWYEETTHIVYPRLKFEDTINDCVPASYTEIIQLVSDNSYVEVYRPSIKIVSYNYLQKTKNQQELRDYAPHLIICDEAHNVKNFCSKTCAGLMKILRPETRVWMLTGTPATKNGQDYYPYLEICLPGQFGTFKEFSDKFCVKGVSTFWNKRWKKKQQVTKYIGVKPEMRSVLQAAFKKIALRRRKSEVLPELPPKLLRYQPVEVGDDLIEKCKQIPEHELAAAMASENPPPHIAHLVREVGEAKVEAAIEFIENCGAPLVVFCVHHNVVDAIAEGVSDRKIGRVTGKQSTAEKAAVEKAFQAGELDLIIATIKAGGTGFTWTAASNVLFAEMVWSPADMDQAADRCHRISQVNCVNITRLVAKGTLDDAIIRVNENKQEFMREVMGDGN